VKQRQAALRPSPGRPAGFEPGTAAEQARFRPGDQRWTVQVPAANAPPQAGAAAALHSEASPEARTEAHTKAHTKARTEALALWWLPQTDPAAPTLLYLHGTFGNLHQNLPKIDALRDAALPGVRWVEIAGGTHSRLHSQAPEIYRRAFTELLQSLPAPSPPASLPAGKGGPTG